MRTLWVAMLPTMRTIWIGLLFMSAFILLVLTVWENSTRMSNHGKKRVDSRSPHPGTRLFWTAWHSSRNCKECVTSPAQPKSVFKYIGPPTNQSKEHSYNRHVESKFILLQTREIVRSRDFQYCSRPGWDGHPDTKPCKVSNNAEHLLESDAVVFSIRDLKGAKDLPLKRLPDQLYTLIGMEPPVFQNNLREFDGLINYTASYRRDADIQIHEGKTIRRRRSLTDKEFKSDFSKLYSLKSKMTTARISRCDATHTDRLWYVGQLQRYIHVHFYGNCGDVKCRHTTKSKDRCNIGIDQGSNMKKYKFYLAFENSNCRDYVTEKFWHPLLYWNSVPVVRGGAGTKYYDSIAPPDSYINTDDFKSPKELAKYLTMLDKHPKLYERYFYWRKQYTVEKVFNRGWCKLCSLLQNVSRPVSQYYHDLEGWFKDDICWGQDP